MNKETIKAFRELWEDYVLVDINTLSVDAIELRNELTSFVNPDVIAKIKKRITVWEKLEETKDVSEKLKTLYFTLANENRIFLSMLERSKV